MRSFLKLAALAAAIVTASIGASYAATPEPHASAHNWGSGGHGMWAGRADTAHFTRPSRIDHRFWSRDDWVYPDPAPIVTYAPQPSPRYAAYTASRLAKIESELAAAGRRINVDRRHGELTPNEVRFVRNEESAVRGEAAKIARANGGTIPAASYAMLQDRVSDLNRTIHRYEMNSALG